MITIRRSLGNKMIHLNELRIGTCFYYDHLYLIKTSDDFLTKAINLLDGTIHVLYRAQIVIHCDKEITKE
jgi:hypothetical protein